MKTKLFAVVGLALLLAVSANAQSTKVKADIPFNFMVNGETLPAGEYTIQSGTSDTTLQISSYDRKVGLVTLANSCENLKPVENSKLVFHRYGDQYFLAQIWTENSTRGRELPKSAREVEVARDSSARNVVIMASR